MSLALLFLASGPSPAVVAARPARPPGRLPLWDRVMRTRWKQSQQLLERAVRLAQRKRYAQAVRALRQATRIRPHAPTLWFALGSVYSLWGRYGACVHALRRCRRLSPTFSRGLLAFRLGLCLSLSGHLEAALQEYRLARHSQHVGPGLRRWNEGDTLMALGRLTEAAAAYRDAIAARPQEPVLRFALAVARHRQGRVAEAMRWARSGLRLDPTGASLSNPDILWLPPSEPHYYRALLHLARHHLVEAANSFARYLAATPQTPWRWAILAHLRRLSRAPLSAEAIFPVRGPLRRKKVARLLRLVVARLRACLTPAPGPSSTPLPPVARIQIAVPPGRAAGVTLPRHAGALRPGALLCVQRALRRVHWRSAAPRTRIVFTVDMVGPSPRSRPQPARTR